MIENMTNEQAAECLKTIHVLSFKDETATFFLTDVQNAFKLAIKALEQQPCEDCISRQAVKEMLNEEWNKYMPMELDINLSFVLEKISELPSVTPKGVTITDFADRCRECGKQKVGKWIDTGIGKEEFYGELFVCSECNEVSFYENYCPNCGAKMEAENEKETC